MFPRWCISVTLVWLRLFWCLGKSQGQAGMGEFSPCSLHQSLALSFLLIPALFRAAFSASPPLCSEMGLWLSSSQGTHVAGPHSHRSDHSSPWLPYGYPLSPPCYSTRESRDRGSLCCFILIIFILSIFCLQISCTLFFSLWFWSFCC